MSADTPSAREAAVEVVREGDRLAGYFTNAWFRYLALLGETVDLTGGVVGELPVANGGTGTAPTAVSVTAAPTLLAADGALFFVIHDQTSGGVSVGVMDRNGVVIPAAFAGVLNVSFTRLAGTGLRAAVTGGANPRSLMVWAINIGAA